MSLIHDALKKVEAQGLGVSVPALGDAGFANKDKERKAVLARLRPGVVVVVVLLALASYYLLKPRPQAPVEKGSHQIFNPAPAEARAVAEKGPADTRVETAKAGSAEPLPQAVASTDAALRNKRGLEDYKAGRFPEAASEFSAAVEAEHDKAARAVYLNNLAQALSRTDDFKKAEEAFEMALTLTPDYPEALNNYGALLVSLGEHKKAVEYLKKAVSLRPDYADPYLNLAVSHEGLGRLNEAAEGYETFLRLNALRPDFERVEDTDALSKRLKRLRSSMQD